MWKHVEVHGLELGLVIKNAPPEIAIPEMEAVGVVDFVAVSGGWVQGLILFPSTNEALARARELVANGWNWGWEKKDD